MGGSVAGSQWLRARHVVDQLVRRSGETDRIVLLMTTPPLLESAPRSPLGSRSPHTRESAKKIPPRDDSGRPFSSTGIEPSCNRDIDSSTSAIVSSTVVALAGNISCRTVSTEWAVVSSGFRRVPARNHRTASTSVSALPARTALTDDVPVGTCHGTSSWLHRVSSFDDTHCGGRPWLHDS